MLFSAVFTVLLSLTSVNSFTIFSSEISTDVDEGVGSPRPKPCATPDQWEGRASEWDHTTEENNRFVVSFDGINRKKRVIEDKRSFMPGRRVYEYFYEYDTNSYYKVNIQDNVCTKYPIQGPWQNHTIPTDAIMEDEYEIGPTGQGLQVREWSDRQPGRTKESWIGIYSVVGCWPIVEVFTYRDKDVNISLTTRFFDITPGIKNMSVFNPPSICFNDNMVEYNVLEEEDGWFDKLVKYFSDESSVADPTPEVEPVSESEPEPESTYFSWYYDLKTWLTDVNTDDIINSLPSTPPAIGLPEIEVPDLSEVPANIADKFNEFVQSLREYFG